MRYSMIMAGGAGTRLWPMSRAARPKQLLPFIHDGAASGATDRGRSLLELAAERLEGVVPPERRLICAAERYRDAILGSVPGMSNDRYLGEPMGRDTVNAVGFAAAVLCHQDPAAVFAVLTSDHLIEPLAAFSRCLDLGFRVVEDDPHRFVTFSIVPTFPATGYGYVERGESLAGFDGAFRGRRFVEKPDLATAQEYLRAGSFGWNSGMFVLSAKTVLEALDRFRPDIAAGLRRIGAAWGTPHQQAVLDEVYPTLFRISVDFALMEPASRDETLSVCTIPMDVRWKDVGSWPTYGETLVADPHGNRANTSTMHVESRNVLAVSDDPDHMITTIGLSDVIIVRTADATLVCAASHAEQVKQIATSVPEALR